MTGTQDPGVRAEEISQPPDEVQPMPVNAMFENDFVTQLVLVLDTDTVEEVARKVAAHIRLDGMMIVPLLHALDDQPTNANPADGAAWSVTGIPTA